MSKKKLSDKMLIGIEEERLNRIFESKLKEEYRHFQHFKDLRHQVKKFYRIFIILMLIILFAMFITTFSF